MSRLNGPEFAAPSPAHDPTLRARRSLAAVGHPERRWSIVIHARLRKPLNPASVSSRLLARLNGHPELGPPPGLAAVPASELATLLSTLAAEPYSSGSVYRLALVDAPDPGIVLAAHHGALDGLGLLALLAIALGEPVTTSARGLGPDARYDGGFGAFAARRVVEALVRPPTRLAGTPPGGERAGETLAESVVPELSGGTIGLTGAAVRAVTSWNRDHGRRADRIAVAIGASQRSGSIPTLEHRAAWLRIRPSTGDDVQIEAALKQAPSLPVGPRSHRWAGVGTLASGLLSRRLGSTLLVSNLGAVWGPPELRALAFYPVTHGRRAVAVGAATIGGTTTLTMRAEARDFNSDSLESLLDLLAAELIPAAAT